MVAQAIAKGVKEMGEQIEVIDVFEGPDVDDLESVDGILLGAYTWGDGELPDDFLDFYDGMDRIQLIGKKAVV